LQKAIFGVLAKLSTWTGTAKTLDKYYIPSPDTQRITG
jgi:hypothetical protein